jgi:hypothetical protein
MAKNMAKSRKRDNASLQNSRAVRPSAYSENDQSVESSGPTQSGGDITAAMPDRDRVARRAYERYLARGGSEGGAMDDWLAAERELAPDRDRKPD